MEACRAALPRVSLRFITVNSLVIASRIEARTLDLGVVFEDGAIPGFLRRKLFRQRLFLIHREPLLGNAETVSLAELSEQPLVMAAHPNVLRDALDRALAKAGIIPNIVAETDSVFSMLSAVQSGIGHTILPKGDMSDVPGHATIWSTPIEPPIYLTASILAAGDAPLTGAGEAVRDLFVGFVAHWLAESHLPGSEWIGDATAIGKSDGPISRQYLCTASPHGKCPVTARPHHGGVGASGDKYHGKAHLPRRLGVRRTRLRLSEGITGRGPEGPCRCDYLRCRFMDAGPYYLGTGTEYFEREAVKADFHHMVAAGLKTGSPVILGSSGMAGGNRNVDFMLDVAKEGFAELNVQDAKIAVITAELDPEVVIGECARVPYGQPGSARSSTRLHCAKAQSWGRWGSIR